MLPKALQDEDVLVEVQSVLLGANVRGGQSEAAGLIWVAATSHALEDEIRPVFTAQLPEGKLR